MTKVRPAGRLARGAVLAAVAGACFAALAGALTLAAALAIAQRDQGGRLFNSDHIQAFLLARDLLADPASLFAWYLPPALFAVPDWVIAVILVASPLPQLWLPVVYGGVALAALAFAAGAVMTVCGLSRPAAAIGAAASLLAVLMLAIAQAPAPGGIAALLLNVAFPGIHGGTLLLGLALIAAVLRLLHREPGPRAGAMPAILLCALSAAGAFSDLFFMLWFAGPAVIAAALLAPAGPPEQAVAAHRVIRLVAISSAAGIALQVALFGLPLGYFLGTMRPPGAAFQVQDLIVLALHSSLLALGEQIHVCALPVAASLFDCTAPLHAVDHVAALMRATFAAADWLGIAVLAAAMLSGARAAWLCLRALGGQRLEPSQSAEILFAGAAWASLTAAVTLNIIHDTGALRYLLPFLAMPILALLIPMLRLGQRLARTPVLTGMALLWAMAAMQLAPAALASFRQLATADPLAACLLQAGHRTGLGDYWSAKAVMFQTGYRVHVVQLTVNGRFHRWIFNRAWFTRHAGDGGPLAPDFIIMRGLDAAAIRDRFGAPSRKEECGGAVIWFYDPAMAMPEG